MTTYHGEQRPVTKMSAVQHIELEYLIAAMPFLYSDAPEIHGIALCFLSSMNHPCVNHQLQCGTTSGSHRMGDRNVRSTTPAFLVNGLVAAWRSGSGFCA